MDTNDILNKFITSMLNVDIQDIESFTIVDTVNATPFCLNTATLDCQ